MCKFGASGFGIKEFSALLFVLAAICLLGLYHSAIGIQAGGDLAAAPTAAGAAADHPPIDVQAGGDLATDVEYSVEDNSSSVAVFLQVEDDSKWELMHECLTHVSAATLSIGLPLALHIIFAEASLPNRSRREAIESSIRGLEGALTVFVQTSHADLREPALILDQLELAGRKRLPYKLALVMGSTATVELVRRGAQSLCGTAPQVVSILQRLLREGSTVDLVAPLGTVVDSRTSYASLSPHVARSACSRQAACPDALLAPGLLQRLGLQTSRLGAAAPAFNPRAAVVVSGGSFWVRYGGLRPGALRDLRRSLLAASEKPEELLQGLLHLWVPSTVRAAGGLLEEAPPAPKVLAIYFPQYHPIPENDRFWGKDFTEWTLLRPFKAKDIRKPLSVEEGGLGYYDLTDKEVRRRQGQMARQHGVYGFVYYHYWFNGPGVDVHKVMHRVPELMLEDGQPSLPFMLSWANEPWTRRWDGEKSAETMLLPQEYGDESEWQEHFEYLLPFFKHPRYIRVNGRPVFAIYRPGLLAKKLEPMLRLWRALAVDSGLPGLHIVVTVGRFYRMEDERRWHGSELLDAALHFVAADRCCWETETKASGGKGRGPAKRPVATGADAPFVEQRAQYWGAFTGFDRRTRGGKLRPQDVVTPEEFESALGTSFAGMAQHPERDVPDNLYFVAAWNEWNEQNILEPDDTYRFQLLEALKRSLENISMRAPPLSR